MKCQRPHYFVKKESTPQNILIPRVDNKILSFLLVPAYRPSEGSRQALGAAMLKGAESLRGEWRGWVSGGDTLSLESVLFGCDFCLK